MLYEVTNNIILAGDDGCSDIDPYMGFQWV